MKKKPIIIVIAILAIILYLFLFGKMFPFSPVAIGFERLEFPSLIVYVQNGAVFNDWSGFDTLTVPVERFHKLKFLKKPEVFVFRDSLSYIRHSPSTARFCAFPGGRLFIAPWSLKEASTGKISLEIYLKHELSHVLIFQQTGMLGAFRYPKWLLEGIAMYSANQMGTTWYPSKTETYNYIRQGNFMPPGDYKTHREKRTKINVDARIAFIYSEFGCIVDYLIESYGREKFQAYMEGLFINGNHDEVFKKIYGIDFVRFLEDFKTHIQKSSLCTN